MADHAEIAALYATAAQAHADARAELERAQARAAEAHARLERAEQALRESVSRNRPLRVMRVDDHRVVIVRRDPHSGAVHVTVADLEG